ncbi:hypothetical protein ACGFYU_30885 [Streptomyces sp. NPDC048337]|uniref:hypothetical protein n=1 Tax=Streptomyces sp. NPDC048337 TaxID=3365535 RepID=UPI00371DE9B6
MNKIYGVVGSAVAGAGTGWLAMVLWQWGFDEDARSCADSVSFCVTPYPLVAIGLWVVLAVPVLWLALRVLNVRPLKATVPAAFVLQAWTLQVLPLLGGRDVPQPSVLTIGCTALSPALVAFCAHPARRRAGLIGGGVLLAASVAFVYQSGAF